MNGSALELHLTNEKSKAKMRVKNVPSTTFKDILEVREADQLTCLAGIDRPLPLLSDMNSAPFFLDFPGSLCKVPRFWSWSAASRLESEASEAADFLSAFLLCTGFRKTLCGLPPRWCPATEQPSERSTFLTFKDPYTVFISHVHQGWMLTSCQAVQHKPAFDGSRESKSNNVVTLS